MRIALAGFSLIVGALALAQGTTGQAPGQIRNEIQGLLGDRHPKAGAEWWQALGPGTPGVILQMLGEGPTLSDRIRLLQGLAWFDDPAATAALKTEAETTGSGVVRNAALRTLGISQGPKELEFLEKFLKHPDVQTRYATAEALKRMGDGGANEILRRYLASEKAGWVSKKLAHEPLGPTGPIQVTASSEDRLSPDWAGKWEGFWLEAKAVGLELNPVEVELELKGSTEVTGKMRVGKAPIQRTFTLKNGLGRARQWNASWVGPKAALPAPKPGAPAAAAGSVEVQVEATLSEEQGTWLVRAVSPKQGGTFVWVKAKKPAP